MDLGPRVSMELEALIPATPTGSDGTSFKSGPKNVWIGSEIILHEISQCNNDRMLLQAAKLIK